MNVYVISLRIYSVWFILVHLAGFFVFSLTENALFSIITELFSIILVFFIANVWVKRYRYFFNNLGHSSTNLYIRLALVNLCFFFVLISTINIFL